MSSIAVWIDSRTSARSPARWASASSDGSGFDHLADVVVKLDQIDEDRPLDLQQQVLFVLLKLGVQAVDHPLAGCFGAVPARITSCKESSRPSSCSPRLFTAFSKSSDSPAASAKLVPTVPWERPRWPVSPGSAPSLTGWVDQDLKAIDVHRRNRIFRRRRRAYSDRVQGGQVRGIFGFRHAWEPHISIPEVHFPAPSSKL